MSQLAEKLVEELSAPPGEEAPGWVNDLRERGVAAFKAQGFPTRRDENWKYTSLQSLEKLQPGLAGPVDGETQLTGPEPLPGFAACVLMDDGNLAGINGQPAPGLEIRPLHEAWADEELRSILESLVSEGGGQGFSALNDATLGNGVVIRVDEGADAGELLLQWRESSASMVNARVVALMGEGSKLQLAEQYENGREDVSVLNIVAQHELGRGAELGHTRLQRHSASSVLVTRTDARQAAGSRFHFTGLDLGAGTARHDVRSELLEENARCDLNGACLGQGESHADHHLEARHLAGNCESSQLFRAVADGRSRVVFNGKVFVSEGADGTDATQSSAGLLLSKLAEIDAKPELEIYADEVVAAHGATVGQLDEEAMFYLRSRGLAEQDARAVLTMAFCRNVTDQLPGEALREALGDRLVQRLSGGNDD